MRQTKNSNYIKYKDIGTRISNGKFENSIIWELLVTEGLWKLPIPSEYGGASDGWEEFIQALKGFSSSYGKFDFLSLVISHACSIYLVLKNDDVKNRQLYLTDLVMGKSVFIYEDKLNLADKRLINKSLIFNAGMFERYLYSIVSATIALNFIKKFDTPIGNNSTLNKINFCANKTAENKIRRAQDMIRSSITHII